MIFNTKIILLFTIIYISFVYGQGQNCVGEGSSCGSGSGVGDDLPCCYTKGGRELSCIRNKCVNIGGLKQDIKDCREKLYSLGLPRGTIVALYGGYCYYDRDDTCRNMYDIINEGNIKDIKKYCDQCNYCF
jgi:hypothetical protein